jgi:hypothetical protein
MMKMETRQRMGWWICTFLLAGAVGFSAYFLGLERGGQERDARPPSRIAPPEKVIPQVETQPLTPSPRDELPQTVVPKESTLDRSLDCQQINTAIQEFFSYLDEKGYITNSEEGTTAYDRFKTVLRKLWSRPPVPAGEKASSSVMTGNIFHFFRTLDREELRWIAAILAHEGDSMEWNLHLFYTWLLSAERCPDQEGIRPSFEVAYQYAGFLLNTVGGRAYLFRRSPELRLLVTYYCLLIIHEADRREENPYGIDILSQIPPLVREISLYPNLLFQEDYLRDLERTEAYYPERGER